MIADKYSRSKFNFTAEFSLNRHRIFMTLYVNFEGIIILSVAFFVFSLEKKL